VEVRVGLPPQPVTGRDGLVHVAYELHVTNYYQSTGTLHLQRVAVLADETLLASYTAAQVNRLLAHPAEQADTAGVPVEAGKRVVLFLWLTLPPGRPYPQVLRHQLTLVTTSGERQLVDGVLTPLNQTPPVVLGPPLKAGPWLTHEGPGNHLSHHWNGVVVLNGQTTIPQRYAIDFFGLTPTPTG
jgi:hypothetical protein